MKRRLGLNRRKVHGIALSVEMILLITAIIVMAIVAYFGMSRIVLSQATSQKSTLVAVRAEGYMLSSNAVAVSLWVQNTGSEPVDISLMGISFGSGMSIEMRTTTPASRLTIRPGETKVVSFAISTFSSVSTNTNVYVFVRASDGSEVGTVTRLASP